MLLVVWLGLGLFVVCVSVVYFVVGFICMVLFCLVEGFRSPYYNIMLLRYVWLFCWFVCVCWLFWLVCFPWVDCFIDYDLLIWVFVRFGYGLLVLVVVCFICCVCVWCCLFMVLVREFGCLVCVLGWVLFVLIYYTIMLL